MEESTSAQPPDSAFERYSNLAGWHLISQVGCRILFDEPGVRGFLADNSAVILKEAPESLDPATARAALEEWTGRARAQGAKLVVLIFVNAEGPEPSPKLAGVKLGLSDGGAVTGVIDLERAKQTTPWGFNYHYPARIGKAVTAALAEWGTRGGLDRATYDSRVSSELQRLDRFEDRLKATTPWGTWLLASVCVAMFGWASVTGGTEDLLTLVRFGSGYPPLVKAGEWWRLVGAMFMHVGVIHLLVNMYSLLMVGPALERFQGNAPYLALYTASGLGGSVLSTALGETTVSAGASGALFGLFGACVYLGWRHRDGIPGALRNRLAGGMIPAILYNLLYGFSHQNIDNASHLGGLLTGVVMAAILGTRVTEERPRPALQAAAALLAVALFATEGYVAYRAANVPMFGDFTVAHREPQGLFSVKLPVGFEPKEGYLAGPGLFLEMASLPGLLNLDDNKTVDEVLAEIKKKKSRILKHELVTADSRDWLIVDTTTRAEGDVIVGQTWALKGGAPIFRIIVAYREGQGKVARPFLLEVLETVH